MPRILPLLALLAATLACGGGAEPEPTRATAVILLPEDIVVVGEQAIAAGPRITGSLEAADQAVLRAEAAGSVVLVAAEIGDRVQKGDVLARIESNAASSAFVSARSSYTSAEQGLRNAERELVRVQRLSAAGALSPRDLELAESGVLVARAGLDGARAQQAMTGEQVSGTTVRAPMAGVVSRRQVSTGDIVAPGAPLFTVIEPSSLRLEGSVPAGAVASLRPGTAVRFQVQGYGDRRFEGTIDRVAPGVDPMTRQIPILVSLPNPDGTLLAGLFAEGRVATEERRGMVVPAEAVDLDGIRPSVLLVRDGAVARVEVELGLSDPDAEVVEIASGVVHGDTLLLGERIAPGTAVELRAGGGGGGGAGG